MVVARVWSIATKMNNVNSLSKFEWQFRTQIFNTKRVLNSEKKSFYGENSAPEPSGGNAKRNSNHQNQEKATSRSTVNRGRDTGQNNQSQTARSQRDAKNKRQRSQQNVEDIYDDLLDQEIYYGEVYSMEPCYASALKSTRTRPNQRKRYHYG